MASTDTPQDGSDERPDSDQALMERIRDGDRTALEVLIGRYWAPLVGYSSGFVGGTDEAEDVVLDVCVRLWRFREAWKGAGAVHAYLYRTTRNLSLNALRDRRGHARRSEASSEQVFQLPPRTPEQQLEMKSLRAEVEAAIASLPKRRREIFVLARFHGLTHREIADALDISTQTVSNQMSAALAELREALADHL